MSNHIDEPTEEEMDFIRAVLANPDDDAIRLIYADWLEERDIRSDYVRQQVQSMRVRYASTPWTRHRRRIYSALDAEHYIAKSELNPPCWDWPRTFFEYLRCPAEWWLKHADEVTKYHPIREVHLMGWPIGTEDARGTPTVYRYFAAEWPQITFVLPNGERIGHEADTATPQAT